MLVKALEREREALRQQGIAIGEERGKEIGKEERNREIVRAMVKKGLALSLVAEVTQLSIATINRLLSEETAQQS